MLKLFLPLFILIKLKNDWGSVQSGLFFLRFLCGIFMYRDFYFSGSGFRLGTDKISYIIIILRV